MNQGPISIEIRRGALVESRHLANVVVMDSAGKTVDQYGDILGAIYPRSSIKMLQALNFVDSGAIEKFNLDERHIALSCASHLGENIHTQVIMDWFHKLGISNENLECGVHFPFDEDSKNNLIRNNLSAEKIHNNCSGKHCGMLSTALAFGFPTKNYIHYDHPIQKNLRHLLSDLSGINYDQAPWGTDGCGIPTYAVPLENIARTMTVFLSDSKRHQQRKSSTNRILKSLKEHPLLLSGTKGLGSALLNLKDADIFAKVGAEGVYTLLLPKQGLSIAFKVHDGTSRASDALLIHLLSHYKALSESEIYLLQKNHSTQIKNWAGVLVGEICVH